jgi:WD40 repeat protein
LTATGSDNAGIAKQKSGVAMNRFMLLLTLLALIVTSSSGQPPEEMQAKRLDRHGEPLPSEAVARIGTPKMRQSWGLYSSAFSADGKLFAGGTVGSLVIVETAKLQNGIELKLEQNQTMPRELVFSPDSTMLLSTSYGSPAHGPQVYNTALWGLTKKQQIHPFGKTEMVAAAFSPDNRILVASFAKPEPSVRLWDLKENREIRRFNGNVNEVMQLAFSPDGKKVLGRTWREDLCCWTVETGVQEFFRKRAAGLLSANGAYCNSSTESYIYDPWTEEVKCKLGRLPRGFYRESFGADLNTFVRVESDKISIWDLTTGKMKDSLPLPKVEETNGMVGSASLSPDNKILAVAYLSQTRFYDLTLPADQRERGWLQEPVWHFRFSPDDQTLLCCNWPPQYPVYYPRLFSLWNVKTGGPLRPLMRLDGTSIFQFLDSGDRVLFAGSDRFDIQDTRTGQAVFALKPITGPALFTHQPAPAPLWVAPSGETMLRPLFNAKDFDPKQTCLQTVHAKTGAVIREIKVEGGSAVVSPDGKTVFTFKMGPAMGPWGPVPHARPTDSATAWNVKTGKKLFTLEDKRRKKIERVTADVETGDPPPKLLAFSPDGKLFAWFQDGLHVYVADTATGETLNLLPPELALKAMTFSPDGKMLAVNSGPSLWEVATGKMRYDFKSAGIDVISVGFSHDGMLLAAGYDDATVIIWDVWGTRSGQPKPSRLEKTLENCWDELADADQREAFAAMRRLVQRGDESVPLIRDRLKTFVEKAGSFKVSTLILALESEVYRERQEADAKLRQLGALALPALREAKAKLVTLEGRQRADKILQGAATATPGPIRRALRALEILELLPLESAKDALVMLSGGDPEQPLTMEANASLERREKNRAP